MGREAVLGLLFARGGAILGVVGLGKMEKKLTLLYIQFPQIQIILELDSKKPLHV